MNKLRARVEGFLSKLAVAFSKAHISPNTLTFLSVLVALAGYASAYYFRRGVLLAALMLASGFLDALDGALARLTGKASKQGAFLDSFADRVCETIFAFGLLELGFNPAVVLAYLALSMMVSYARARGEGLGVSTAGVGLMERAERLIALAVASTAADYSLEVSQYIIVATVVLTAVTVVERFAYIWRALQN